MRSVIMTLALAALPAWAATFTVDSMRQHYPWNGLVDVDYTVTYGQGESALDPQVNRLEAMASDLTASPVQAVRMASFDVLPLPLAAGTHRVTWNAKADGLASLSDNVKVELVLVQVPSAPKYMVLDLSSGCLSARYPVTYLDAPPAGGFNTLEYKTEKMVFRLVPPGSFVMGAPESEPGRQGVNEKQHPVTLTKPFYLGLFEVTHGQLSRISGQLENTNEHNAQNEAQPASSLKPNIMRGGSAKTTAVPKSGTILDVLRTKTGLAFDLPTEAQWEYACRAGTTTPFNDGVPCADVASLTTRMANLGRTNANVDDPRGVFTSPAGYSRARGAVVGSYAPNAWGFYDMHGNECECVRDAYDTSLASKGLVVDPVSTTGSKICGKGGAFSVAPARARSAARSNWSADTQYADLGYRFALTLD